MVLSMLGGWRERGREGEGDWEERERGEEEMGREEIISCYKYIFASQLLQRVSIYN